MFIINNYYTSPINIVNSPSIVIENQCRNGMKTEPH